MTFLNQKTEELNNVEIVKIGIIGIKFDGERPSAQIGVNQGPYSIRRVSQRYANTNGVGFPSYIYNPEEGYLISHCFFHDWGDKFFNNDIEKTIVSTKEEIHKIICRNEIPCIIGGDHFISYPVLMVYNAPITVIQFDAHSDYLDRTNICPHGSVMRLVNQLPNVAKIIHCGLRGNLTSKEDLEESILRGNNVIFSSQIKKYGTSVLNNLVEENSSVYLSIDIDVLDPSVAFATRTIEPDGISYRQLLNLMHFCAKHFTVVGVDIVEYDPSLDWNDVTGNLICNLIFEFFSKITLQMQ